MTKAMSSSLGKSWINCCNHSGSSMFLVDVITRLADAPSRSAKEKIILDAYAANCLEFFEAMRLALDPFVVFPVTKVASIIDDDGYVGELSFTEFQAMCQKLSSLDIPPDAVRQMIYQAAEKCHAPT